MKLIMGRRDKHLVTHAMTRAVRLVGDTLGLDQPQIEQMLAAVTFQIAYDHLNPMVAGELIDGKWDGIDEIWNEAYMQAEAQHKSEKVILEQ